MEEMLELDLVDEVEGWIAMVEHYGYRINWPRR